MVSCMESYKLFNQLFPTCVTINNRYALSLCPSTSDICLEVELLDKRYNHFRALNMLPSCPGVKLNQFTFICTCQGPTVPTII